MASRSNPLVLPIAKIDQETENVRTFTFEYEFNSRPGQFVMLWVPGVDQKPFSIANDKNGKFELTIFALGKATNAVFEMKVGDKLGISGPYGSAYRFKKDSHVITVGGGYGAAPLAFATDNARAAGCSVDFLVGARSKEDLLFEERAALAGANVVVATDDGSKGHKGYVTDVLVEILEQRKKDGQLEDTKVLTCGPELMQHKVATICAEFGVPSEVSIERYMKCGFGICGNCTMDGTGQTTCLQGLVVSGEQALGLEEFGKYHRDKTGIRHEF